MQFFLFGFDVDIGAIVFQGKTHNAKHARGRIALTGVDLHPLGMVGDWASY
ncbi:hypothetical protein [Labrys neptuniae]